MTTDRGVVQSVSPTSIVLRALGGSTVAIALGRRTRIRVNGLDATLGDLQPGLVAAVTHDGDSPARIVRAFGAVKIVEKGSVESVDGATIVVRRLDGTTVAIELRETTRVRRFGRPAGRRAIRPGRLVRVTYRPGSPALLVAVVRHL